MAKKRATQTTARTAKKPVPAPKGCATNSDTRLDRAATTPNERFSKGLDHDPTSGEVNAAQFANMIGQLKLLNVDPGNAAQAGWQLRTNTAASLRKFVNPMAGWALDTQSTDPCCYSLPAPPAIDSVEEAAEIIELYWMALLRDVPFAQWEDNPLVAAAACELSTLPLFVNRTDPNGEPATARFETLPLNAKNVFRGGELARFGNLNAGISESVGPYISQFLFHEIPYGTLRIPQRFYYAKSGVDYLTDWQEWLRVQNGERRNPNQNLIGLHDAAQRRYLTTPRDLATYVHFDALYQAYLDAALILLGSGYPTNPGNPYGPGCSVMGIGQDDNPLHQRSYLESLSKPPKPKYPDQDGFGTFGGPHILSLVTEVATRALKTVWRQKWTHLRLRPEAYAGLVHRAIVSGVPAPYENFSPEVVRVLRGSQVIDRLLEGRKRRHRWQEHAPSSALLPMAFPEGSPTHPAYGAGHATVAGASVTVLKAFFDASVQFIGPVEASADGNHLVPYQGMDAHSGKLTVELELNKLAANVGIGRNMGGVHWRSDYTQSMLLGQRVAIDMLYRQSSTYPESYCYLFNSFGGKSVEIHAGGVKYDGRALNLPAISRGECPSATTCDIANELNAII